MTKYQKPIPQCVYTLYSVSLRFRIWPRLALTALPPSLISFSLPSATLLSDGYSKRGRGDAMRGIMTGASGGGAS